jgi:hypothetical protein
MFQSSSSNVQIGATADGQDVTDTTIAYGSSRASCTDSIADTQNLESAYTCIPSYIPPL